MAYSLSKRSIPITFDPTLFYTNDSADVTVNFLNSPLTSLVPPVFSYQPDFSLIGSSRH